MRDEHELFSMYKHMFYLSIKIANGIFFFRNQMKNITFLDGDFVGLGNLTTFVISCTVLRTCASGQFVHFKIHVLSLLPLLSFFGCLVLGLSVNFLSYYLCGFFSDCFVLTVSIAKHHSC